MFPGVSKDKFDRFGIKLLEEENHDKGVHESDSTSILESIAEALEEW